ncbi:MAG: DUF2062 domain-containing protein [Candidatus Omnitrophica bacterium]|jgi:hypothetical protein|nr:DUF2062 domain-containing protein [Candidatus Omnitrophota bacterium]MDD5660519.1 DUF2062 domain-containing protein [Candidatus Omnitrophota bacterium]
MFKKAISFLSAKLLKINDTPHKIALGAGLGIFSGIIPGTGPLAALFLAFLFRANRAAALLGSMFTNTWLSFVTFIFAIKIGSAILDMKWQDVEAKAHFLISDFSFNKLFKLSFFDAFLPIVSGYLVIGLVLGLFSYLITLLIIRRKFHGIKKIHP